jgi:hypothetical protein
MTVVHEKIDEMIISMHHYAPPELASSIMQLTPLIKKEIPRLGIAASKVRADGFCTL